MLSPHTTCPSCHEEVYLEELIRGRCPLCGYSLEENEDSCDEYDEMLGRADLSWLVFSYALFRRFGELGVPPLRILELVAACEKSPQAGEKSTHFDLEIPQKPTDRIMVKKCQDCSSLFITGARKWVAGDLTSPDVRFYYTCPRCRSVGTPDKS